jgi:glycogen synthase
VLKTKVTSMLDHCKGEYILIGPLFDSSLREVEPCDVPPIYADILDDLEKIGIKCVFGSWLIEDSPLVILLDIAGHRSRAQELCYLLQEKFSIFIEPNDAETIDAVIFGYLVFKLLQIVNSTILTDRRTIG